MSIEALKYEIFTQLMTIHDATILQKVKELLENISKENELLYRIFKPMREKITVEDLIREQNYKGFDRDTFDKLVKDLNIQDPIEDLLALCNA